MIRGITPIDAGFELMGLHQAQALIRFIFLESMAGKFIFTLGFILSLRAGWEKGNFRPVFIFMVMFFSMWFLLVVPRARAGDSVSAMERAGYQGITTVEVLKKNGYNEVMVDPVLDIVSRSVDSLMTAVSAVLERGADGRGYLASPFLMIKVSLVTTGIIDKGITDPALEERTVRFYQDHFWPAVRTLRSPPEDLWPGSADIVAGYQEKGRGEWESLRDALYQACDRSRIFSRMFEHFYGGKTDKDGVVRSLLGREVMLKTPRYTMMAYATGPGQRRSEAPGHAVGGAGILFSQKVMLALPFAQGILLFIVWSMVPVFLATALLSRRPWPLCMFIGALFLVKGWTVAWAILDKVSVVWFGVHTAWGGPAMWEGPGLNVFIALAAVIVPAVMTVGGFLAGRIKVEGHS